MAIVIAECGNNPRTEANVIGNLVEEPIAPCQALIIPLDLTVRVHVSASLGTPALQMFRVNKMCPEV